MADNNMTLIQAVTVGAGGAAYLEFTSIPQTYTDLVLECSTRHNTGGTVANFVNISLNGSSSSLSGRYLLGNGSTASAGTGQYAGLDAGAGATASTFSNTSYYFANYTSNQYKSWSVDSITENNAVEAYAGLISGLWSNTSAITSIRLTPQVGTLVQYSTAYLYGVASAAVGAKATGGNIISQDADYYYHIFTSSGTFTPTQSLTADYLVVAGGAGGASGSSGGGNGGGGGAGGLRCTVVATGGGGSLESALSLTAQAYTVTIGAGGAGGSISGFDASRGANGSNSVFSTITSTGGGGGGSFQRDGYSGGSGGGAGQSPGNAGGAGTTNQGYAGGTTTGGSGIGGSGGGGAGQIGGNCTSANGGVGGNGIATTMAVGGVSTYYAGGGGGSTHNSGNNLAIGGLGGGGNGRTASGSPAQVDGTANTGGGGGGGGEGTTGANGGSGIVIVRYAK